MLHFPTIASGSRLQINGCLILCISQYIGPEKIVSSPLGGGGGVRCEKRPVQKQEGDSCGGVLLPMSAGSVKCL